MPFSLNMVKEKFVAKGSKSLSGGQTLMSPIILISYVVGCSLISDSDVLGLTQILKCQQKKLYNITNWCLIQGNNGDGGSISILLLSDRGA